MGFTHNKLPIGGFFIGKYMPLVMGAPHVGGYFGSAEVGITATGNLGVVSGKKWHPGHYMQILRSNSQTVQSVRFGYYDLIASETALQGVVVPFRWAQLEGAKGDYSAGITLVQSEIDYLKALTVPKRLIIRINDHAFGESFENTFPAYMNTEGMLYDQGFAIAWKRWNSTAMGYFIDMWEAYATEFDDEPYLESIYLYRETATGGVNPPDYSGSGYVTQTERLVTAGAAAFTKTNVIMPVNFFVSTGATDDMFVHMESEQVGTGNPDTCKLPDCNMWGDNTLRGDSGGVDYRGVIPVQYSVETSEIGGGQIGPAGGYTPQEIYDYWTVLQVSHGFWDRNEFAGTSEQRWPTGILPFIQANPNLVHEGAPSIYTQGVDTS